MNGIPLLVRMVVGRLSERMEGCQRSHLGRTAAARRQPLRHDMPWPRHGRIRP